MSLKFNQRTDMAGILNTFCCLFGETHEDNLILNNPQIDKYLTYYVETNH